MGEERKTRKRKRGKWDGRIERRMKKRKRKMETR